MATYHKYECKVLALLIGKDMNERFNVGITYILYSVLITNIFSAGMAITCSFSFPLPKLKWI